MDLGELSATSAANDGSYAAAYTYGPDGLRLRVQESNHAYPDRWFQYDGVRPVLEGTLSEDTFTAANQYVWEGNDYYSPLIHADFNGSDRYFAYDGLGSTRQLLDSDEDVTDSYSYEAFGNVLSDGGPTLNPYRYVGSLGYYATGSSLLHLGARYYMPEIGRFAQRELAEPASLSASSHYAYATANPVRFQDASGLTTEEWCHCEHRKCLENLAEEGGVKQCVMDALRGIGPITEQTVTCLVGCLATTAVYGACLGTCALAAGALDLVALSGCMDRALANRRACDDFFSVCMQHVEETPNLRFRYYRGPGGLRRH